MFLFPGYILAIEDDSDRAFMEELYTRYHKLVISKVRDSLTDADNSWQDVVQTTWMRLIRHTAQLRELDSSRMASYIVRTAVNAAKNHNRGGARHAAVPLDETWDQPDPEDGVESRLIRMEEIGELYTVWKDLDEETQSLLSDRYILGMTPTEMAQQRGEKPGTVRVALSRARKKALRLIEAKRGEKAAVR